MEAPGGASPLSPALVGRLRQEHEKVTAARMGCEEGARRDRGRGLERDGGAGRVWGGARYGGGGRLAPGLLAGADT